MKKILLLQFIIALNITFVYSNNFEQNDYLIDFGDTKVGDTYSKSITFVNNLPKRLNFENLNFESIEIKQDIFSRFSYIQNNTKEIKFGDSLILNFNLKPEHNTVQKGVAILKFNSIYDYNDSYTIVIDLISNATYKDTVYNFTSNLIGETLKTALYNYAKGHYAFSYKDARRAMFQYIDNKAGWVECVYTGRKIQTNDIPPETQFNTEHTWPQSKFASGDEIAKSDLFHLYPTTNESNTVRGNAPFGIPVSNISYNDTSGSKFGYDAYNQQVFEPRNLHKGNAARSMFYFCVAYNNPFPPYFNNQEGLLRLWAKLDPVDSAEMARNNYIAYYQKRRNPFIDHPEFLDRIPNLAGVTTFPAKMPYNIDSVVKFDLSYRPQGDSLSKFIYIYNPSLDSNKIKSIEFEQENNNFELLTIDSVLKPNSYTKILVRAFLPKWQWQPDSAFMNVRYAKGLYSSQIKLYNYVWHVGVEENSNSRFKIYPNPSSNEINILSDEIIRSIRLFDIHGAKIAEVQNINLIEYRIDLSSLNLNNGSYNIEVEFANGKMECSKIIIAR